MSLTTKLQTFYFIGFAHGVTSILAAQSPHPAALVVLILSAVPLGFGMATLQKRWFSE